MARDDDELDEAERAEISEFVREAEARRLRNLPPAQPGPVGPEATGPPTTWSGDVPLDGIAETFRRDGTPLIRTDFSDDRAWMLVVADVTKPRDFEGSPYGPYEPPATAFDDRFFEGVTGESLAQAWGVHEDLGGYVVLADARTMAEAVQGVDITVDYVDLSVVLDDEDPESQVDSFPGRTFRCAVSEFPSVEANLAIANMDFSDFADHVDPGGVFRGFAPDA